MIVAKGKNSTKTYSSSNSIENMQKKFIIGMEIINTLIQIWINAAFLMRKFKNLTKRAYLVIEKLVIQKKGLTPGLEI